MADNKEDHGDATAPAAVSNETVIPKDVPVDVELGAVDVELGDEKNVDENRDENVDENADDQDKPQQPQESLTDLELALPPLKLFDEAHNALAAAYLMFCLADLRAMARAIST